MANGPAVVLLSGGLDSLTALAWALEQGYIIRKALSYTYGQRHAREISSATAIAHHYGVPHEWSALAPISGSQLTDGGQVPQGRELDAIKEEVALLTCPTAT